MSTGLAERLRASLAHGYRIERELGSGGMATVYLAADLRHDRQVALKVLRPDLADAVGTGRFLREIATASRLSHPNILPLLDSGDADGLPFYVMPYVAGESLRDLLDRERQLPIADALRIARDVAEALEYAHRHGVVHRDIKPENILLQSGRAVVADFGIARAIVRSAPEDRLTRTGITLGTPAYMSPEQAGAESEIDGRSDIYALGIVLYEMLAGQPPFTGPSVQAIMARHQLDPVPPLRTVRTTVPIALERAVLRALAKVPADRFATAERFGDALTAADAQRDSGAHQRPISTARSAAIAGGILAVLALAAWGLTRGDGVVATSGDTPLDTARIAIIAVSEGGRVAASLDEEQLLRDAFTRWDGVAVADRFMVRDALTRFGDAALGPDQARRIAARLGAGRYIRLELSRVGDSTRARAALFDATGAGAPLAEATVRVAADLRGADSAFAALADRLLFRGGAPAARAARSSGTRSLPARQAFVAGQAAIEQWELAAADSAFTDAIGFDPGYAEASLWLAVTRWWADSPAALWRSPIERAVGDSLELGHRDRGLAAALSALGQGDTEAACARLGRLAQRDQHDFAVWYAWATCLRRDPIVVRDARSGSGWRFRSSYHRALVAYQRAFVLLPSMHVSLSRGAFEPLRGALLITGSGVLQSGRAAPPDTGQFRAFPGWQGDTLTLIPYRARDFREGRPWTTPPTQDEAVRQQRLLFREVATAWVAAYPRSAAAMEALALALDYLGERAALDTLRHARLLSTDAAEGVRLGATEVWMRLKRAIPPDTAGIRAAMTLADSVIGAASASPWLEPQMASALAALQGRAELAASLYRRQRAVAQSGVPAPLASSAPALLVFAALGGPADSIAALEARVRRTIENELDPSLRPQARHQWLVRPATLALPHFRSAVLPSLRGDAYYLADAAATFAAGDTAATLATLTRLAGIRRSMQAADLPLDALFVEAWLLAALNRGADAARWLDPTLAALGATAPGTFDSDPARAASLVHAMALRADLAHALGDRAAARRWAAVVALLWKDADPFLNPVVERMRRLTR